MCDGRSRTSAKARKWLSPTVARLRDYLRANDNALVYQVRRGGFVLGASYKLKMPPAAT